MTKHDGARSDVRKAREVQPVRVSGVQKWDYPMPSSASMSTLHPTQEAPGVGLSEEEKAEWREKAEYDARWWGSAHAGHVNAERVLALLDRVAEVEREREADRSELRDEEREHAKSLAIMEAACDRVEKVESDLADLRAGLGELAGDLWRVAPCGCGHRADLHRLDAGCTGGLLICSCNRTFSSLLTERIRALISDPAAVLREVKRKAWDEGARTIFPAGDVQHLRDACNPYLTPDERQGGDDGR